ncbi:MAG: purine-nucleoside phosphorylase [Candidatus Sericytochromatia bacterium]|nr:purine-nucleoside phosphorylase [Candidatus Sericytochromatia bacterium]
MESAAEFIRGHYGQKPSVGIILGSGLGSIAGAVSDSAVLPYGTIPHFPVSTAPGHAGNLVLGTLEGHTVAVMQGRFHLYEGYTPHQVAFPIRVMRALGVDTLIVTCATGGLNHRFKAGDLMLIHDHINLMGVNPLVGPNDPEIGERFPVMFDAYRPDLIELAHRVALKQGVVLREGVYAGIQGPAYFTKAELRYLIKIGADSIGMSTVPEVITATHAGMRVLGIGTISDMAIPDSGHHATEEEILAVARRVGPTLERLVRGILAAL